MAATIECSTAAAADDTLALRALETVVTELEPASGPTPLGLVTTPKAQATELTVLAIEDDPVDRFLLGDALSLFAELSFAAELGDGIALAWRGEFDVVVLDLGLPGCSGLDALREFRAAGPDLPLVVLSGVYEDVIGVDALREGAQDYLSKHGLDERLLRRSLRYAIERHALHEELQELAIVDPLTGLLNRRGFDLHGHQAIARAARAGGRLTLLYLDVDGLKSVNDAHGHGAGDDLLSDLADALRQTFRSSDIVTRIGGDEFCVLFTEGADNWAAPARRLEAAIEERNRTTGGPAISISAGAASWAPERPVPLEDLVREGDRRMLDSPLALAKRARGASA